MNPQEKSQKLAQTLSSMAKKYDVISHQRGRGYMQAFMLVEGLASAPFVKAWR